MNVAEIERESQYVRHRVYYEEQGTPLWEDTYANSSIGAENQVINWAAAKGKIIRVTRVDVYLRSYLKAVQPPKSLI
jgi:hypothetical protein